MFDNINNLFFDCYFYDKSKLKPLTPLADAIGVNSILTLSKFPKEINASWRTPNNSSPTILHGRAEAINNP